MQTISLKATPNLNALSFKSVLTLFGQWFGAFIAFIPGMIVANIVSPLLQFVMEKMARDGIHVRFFCQSLQRRGQH